MIIALPITLAVALWLTWRFCNPASRLHILDHPNERSLHAHPVPRSGGVAVVGGLVAGWFALRLLGDGGWALDRLLLIALPVAVISFLDDRSGINPGLRILVHLDQWIRSPVPSARCRE